MNSNYKHEFVIGSLLLATLALTLANQYFKRSIELTPKLSSVIGHTYENVDGGNSQSIAENVGGSYKIRYVFDADVDASPSADLELPSEKETCMDLSWIDYFEIEIGSDMPEGDKILFLVRSLEPGISAKKDCPSQKFSEALLTVSSEIEPVRIKRDQFVVPTWWKRKYSVDGDSALPSFNMVEQFQFRTFKANGAGKFVVRSIKCTGHWINIETLNKTLLWLWLGGVLIGCVIRVFKLKKKLHEKTASALELQQHNNLLASESATYQELARRDPLTGLLNRYGLEGKFESLSSAGGFAYSLIVFDLDHFKQINDTHGHCYGDRALFDIARIVKCRTGESDIVARWGGDEFIIILNGQSLEDAYNFSEEIRQAVSQSDLDYTCSFGISKSETGVGLETVLRNADQALYDAKGAGRDQVGVHQKHAQDTQNISPSQPAPPTAPILPTIEMPTSGFTVHS